MSKNVIKWESRHGMYQAGVSMVGAVMAHWLPLGEGKILDAIQETSDYGDDTRHAYDNAGVAAWLVMLAEWGAVPAEIREHGGYHFDCPEYHMVGNEWGCGSHSVESPGYQMARVARGI